MWKVGNRVEIPYTNPNWQNFKEGVVAETRQITPLGGGRSYHVVLVQEVHRDNWVYCDPEKLKPWVLPETAIV